MARADVSAERGQVRLATFNLLHGRSLDDGRVDLDRLTGAVRELDADVLALQEVDRDQPRSHGADLTAVVAEAMGAVDFRFVPTVDGTPGERWTPATGEERTGRPAYGVALVSRYPVRAWRTIRLGAARMRVPMFVPGRRRPLWVVDEPRAALAAEIDGPAGAFTACSTHLSFVPGWNRRQLRTVVQDLADPARPFALLGDLNMAVATAARVSGLQALAELPTFPAPAPRRQLDHVLADGGIQVSGPPRAPRLPVSDHRALVVDCTIGRLRD